MSEGDASENCENYFKQSVESKLMQIENNIVSFNIHSQTAKTIYISLSCRINECKRKLILNKQMHVVARSTNIADIEADKKYWENELQRAQELLDILK